MILIRNSKLFMIIALLIFVCCLPHALGGWANILNRLGAAASITALLATLGIKISDDIKNKEKDLEGLKEELVQINKQLEEYKKAYEELLKEIEDLKAHLAELGREEYDAALKVYEMEKALEAAKKAVEQAEAALDAATTNYNSHIMDCYECEHDYECYTADALYAQMVAAEEDLEFAKRRLEIAQKNYDNAAKEWARILDAITDTQKALRKCNKKLKDIEEAVAPLLTRKTELAGDENDENDRGEIGRKEDEKAAAQKYLQTVENAEDTLPGYVASYIEAKEALDNDGDCDDGDCDDGDETDMEQWIEDNPPPESVAEFLDAYEEITEKYGD